MFLLVPAYPGCPGSKAVKRSLLLLLFLLEHRATSFLHFGLSPADLYAPIHVGLSPISCKSSLSVVRQVFVGLPGQRLPLSGCQFMAIYAGLFSVAS